MYLAPLNYDRFFKKVFSDEKIAKRFLEDFLDIGIEELEKLGEKHRVTDEASIVEFDFRCKIENSYIIIDMQQWYKQDVVQRFYLYHALNTGLQLDKLPKRFSVFDETTKEYSNKVKSYRALEPVITLIWMVVDSLKFKEDFVSYKMIPEVVSDFVKNENIWNNPEIPNLIKERKKVLEIMDNETKNLSFLSENRLIFMFQSNIIKNKKIGNYEKWFEFAEKTRNENNKEEDFKEYTKDKVFSEMIRRLNKSDLTENDIVYIESEKEFWKEVKKLEKGMYKEGKEEGIKKGKEEGIKEGIKKGKIEGEI
jgi:hypothetical protein